jgi:hypothetical protein
LLNTLSKRSAAALVSMELVLAICGGCQPASRPAPAPQIGGPPAAPPPPGVVQGSAPAAATATPAAVPALAVPEDPVELARLSLAALAEKVRLIASVHDLDSARAVSREFPAVDARHRQLSEKLGNRLLSEEARQQIDAEFGPQERELGAAWAKEYHRVAFIPGAWEYMHPQLTPFADLTVMPQDPEGLEREATRMLTTAIDLLRQATDANQALEVSPRYRVSTCRLSSVLTKLSAARGGTGVREVLSPQIVALRRVFDDERKRMGAVAGAHDALLYGEPPSPGGSGAASLAQSFLGGKPSATDQVLQDLRSGEVPRVRNAVVLLGGMQPGGDREAIGAELIKLLDFEPARGSAVEALKHGWFARNQIPQIRDAMARQEDRGYRYSLAEGISRTADPEPQTIEFLARLFAESPGDAVRVLRNVGPAAEPVAQQYAGHPQVEVRIAVCELLRDIGTEASLPTLQKLAQDPDRGVADKAQEAVREIGKPLNQRPHLRDRP